MPLLVEGRRVRLPQTAGDLVRAHPPLEVSMARAGGYEADLSPPHLTATSRSPPKQTLNLAQPRCCGRWQPTFCLRWRRLRSFYLWTLEGIC